ncbi:HAD family hydrolase [Sinorhizobium arboris]|uniref:HAD family hydrolase n=1 Tax=Sinorhizobium arboris TaxID=76745 RepID=UPI001F1F1319|nr:HAD-IA family hydrolase [Sinorhizobium arboris]
MLILSHKQMDIAGTFRCRALSGTINERQREYVSSPQPTFREERHRQGNLSRCTHTAVVDAGTPIRFGPAPHMRVTPRRLRTNRRCLPSERFKGGQKGKLISHISFDVWNTLVLPNPRHALTRTKFLAACFHTEEATVRNAYAEVKRWVNQHAIETGYAPSLFENIRLLMMHCNVHKDPSLIAKAFENIFENCKPIVLDTTVRLIQALVEDGYALSLGSNSSFISGRLVHDFLESSFGSVFRFGIYSDLLGYAKPKKAFFKKIIKSCDVAANNILHVGDHAICDLQGAQSAGMHGALLGRPEDIREVVHEAISGVCAP